MFRFIRSHKTANETIRTKQPPQQAAVRAVELKIEDIYHIALNVLTGLRLVRVRQTTKTSKKLMRKYETSIRFITENEDIRLELSKVTTCLNQGACF
jgi:hypothetical protein